MLELGIYKNFKELCESVGWNATKGGTYKKARLKELDTICNWHKEGNKIVITEVYGELSMEEDKRKYNGNNGHSTSKYTMIDTLIHNQLYGYDRILTKNQILQIIGISIDKDDITKECNVNEYTINDFMEVYNSIVNKLIDTSLDRMNKNKTIEYSKVIVIDNEVSRDEYDYYLIDGIESGVIQEMNIKNVYTLSNKKKKAYYNKCDERAKQEGICKDYYYKAYELKKIDDIEDYNGNAKQELMKQICKSIKNSNAFKNKIEYSKNKFDKQKEIMTNDDEWGESIYNVLGEEVILDNLSKADRNRLSDTYMNDIDTIINFILRQCK